MSNEIKDIAFDLDGVLIDSIEIMKKAWKSSCKLVQIDIPFIEYEKKIGLPFDKILEDFKIDRSLFGILRDEYNKVSILNLHLIKPYESAIDVLYFLKKKNFNLHIVTSKEKERTSLIVEKFFSRKLFKHIITPDDLGINEGKPNPKSIEIIISKQKINSSNLLFIGDTYIDYECSRNSGCKFLFAEWGYGTNIKNSRSIKNIKDLMNFQ